MAENGNVLEMMVIASNAEASGLLAPFALYNAYLGTCYLKP